MLMLAAKLTEQAAERVQERRFPGFELRTSLGSVWQYPRDIRGAMLAFFMPGVFLPKRGARPGDRPAETAFPEWSDVIRLIGERYFSFARRGFDPVIVTGQTSEEIVGVRQACNFHIPILADSDAKLLRELGLEQFAFEGSRYHPYFAIKVQAGLVRRIFFRFEQPVDLIGSVINGEN
jgi:hypothetical protein